MILDLTNKHIDFFIEGCRKIGIPEKELPKICEIAQTSIKYYQNSKNVRKQIRELQELENKWYESLSTNNPWYGVYSAPYYIADLWACWVVYSRKYLHSILSKTSMSKITEHGKHFFSLYSEIKNSQVICDLGCGIGLSTAALKEMFPTADVYGTNILGNQQADFAVMLSKEYDFTLIPSISKINKEIDLIFASEYFEHFYEPIEHLREILSYAPKSLLLANAFTAISIGHFPQYMVDGVIIDGKKTSRIFNAELRKWGYVKINTKLWNNRPTYWKRNI